MKNVGYTKNGNVIVELHEAEYNILMALSEAVKGRIHDYHIEYIRKDIDEDLSYWVEAVHNFVEMGFKINALQNHVDELKKLLEND